MIPISASLLASDVVSMVLVLPGDRSKEVIGRRRHWCSFDLSRGSTDPARCRGLSLCVVSGFLHMYFLAKAPVLGFFFSNEIEVMKIDNYYIVALQLYH